MTSMKKEEYWRQADQAQIESPEAFVRGQNEYWRQVDESEGFDLEGIEMPHGTIGISPFKIKKGFGYHFIVDLYAKLGLHRYNMLEGTNFQLIRITKFNTLMNCLSSYYITLVASDPVTCLEQTFQVKVDENYFGRLDVNVSVARPKGGSTMEPSRPRDARATHSSYNNRLSEWPSEDAFNDSRRFYMVGESELRDTDWIRLYLELVLSSKKDRTIKASDLSKLKIVKVAIETSNDVEPRLKAKSAVDEDAEPPNKRLKAKSAIDEEDAEPPNKRLKAKSAINEEDVEAPNKRLNAKNAIVYITFRLASHGISEHVERRAIVRRGINEHTGRLILYDALTPFKKDTGFIERLLSTPVSPEVLAMVRSRSSRP